MEINVNISLPAFRFTHDKSSTHHAHLWSAHRWSVLSFNNERTLPDFPLLWLLTLAPTRLRHRWKGFSGLLQSLERRTAVSSTSRDRGPLKPRKSTHYEMRPTDSRSGIGNRFGPFMWRLNQLNQRARKSDFNKLNLAQSLYFSPACTDMMMRNKMIIFGAEGWSRGTKYCKQPRIPPHKAHSYQPNFLCYEVLFVKH